MTLYAVEYVYQDSADAQETINALRPAHRQYLSEVAAAGSLLGSGPFTEGAAGALLVFSAPDDAAVAQLLVADPFAEAGVISLTTVRPWKLIIGPWAQGV